MCLIALALDQHPAYSLVLATNRDEIHGRPTEPMHWWPESESLGQPLLAGRDRQSGGTWLAIRQDGGLALVTNYRSGTREVGKRSRGNIPLELLARNPSANSLAQLHADRQRYSGFNVITGRADQWFYCGSEDRVAYRNLYRGFYGLSNHLLQSDWPKVALSRQLLKTCLDTAGADTTALHDNLISAFRHEQTAVDGLLPDTGVGLALERLLSPVFIRGDTYGTRATSVVTVERNGMIRVTEQQYGPGGVVGDRQAFHWQHRALAQSSSAD